MQTLRLASVALQAERVRWRHTIRRVAVMVALAVVGLVVLTAGLAAGHVALYALLADRFPAAGAAGILAGGDLLVALIVVWIAAAMGPNASEREAAELSETAQREMGESLSWTRMFNFSTIMTMVELFRSRRK